MTESLQREIGRRRKPKAHITFDVETGDAIEQRSLPFVVGVLGDFSGRPVADANGEAIRVRDRKVHRIDRDSFDQVLAEVGPEVSVTVDNRVGPEGGKLAASLSFRALEDFEPQNIARQIPALRELLELRRRLAELKQRLDGNDELDRLLRRAAQLEKGEVVA
ncbi:MAG: type VI secretion system contractile sheath small subunit [Planctomycetota bacterium]